MIKCVEEIKKGEWIVPAFRLLRDLALLFPEENRRLTYTPKYRTRKQVMQTIDATYSLKSIVVATLSEYSTLARDKVLTPLLIMTVDA